MKVEKIIRKSHFYCEDRFVIKDNFYMVIDGATPLINDSKNFKGSSASYFVSQIKKDLIKNEDIFSSLSNTSKRMFEEFSNEDLMPSAAMSFIRIIDGRVVCSYLGDTEIFIRFKNGKSERIFDERLVDLDKIALDAYAQNRKKFNNFAETLESIRPILVKNRRLMNKQNGYSIYCPNKDGKIQFAERVFDLDSIEEIYLYTDGFSDAVETFGLFKSVDEMLTIDADIGSIVKQIVDEASRDKQCLKYPRFKTIDDITAIKISF